ncbi:hypothetical protein NL676_019558 [Syzygium grande]|nr:hypothetical protein NL676_019558 [Syzygium grande]
MEEHLVYMPMRWLTMKGVAGECGLDEVRVEGHAELQVFLGDASCDERDVAIDGWDDIAEEHGNAPVVSPIKMVHSAFYRLTSSARSDNCKEMAKIN